MNTISLSTKIADAIELMNNACTSLKGKRFADFGEFHSLIRNCINDAIIFEDEITCKTWAITKSYDFDLFTYSREVTEDKRRRYVKSGRIIQVIFSVNDKQTDHNSGYYTIPLNNPVTIGDLYKEHEIWAIKHRIDQNNKSIQEREKSITELRERNAKLLVELHSKQANFKQL